MFIFCRMVILRIKPIRNDEYFSETKIDTKEMCSKKTKRLIYQNALSLIVR